MAKMDHQNLSEFVRISSTLAKVAKTSEHLANPFFNIPNCTKKSELLYPDLIGRKFRGWRLLDSMLGAAFVIIRSFLYLPQRIKPRADIKTANVVVVSHLTNLEHLTAINDFYYDNIVSRLMESGISTHLCLINHIVAKSSDVQQTSTRTVLPAYLSPIRECVLLLRLLLSIHKMPVLTGNSIEKKFSRMAKMSQFNSRAIGNLRIGLMLSDIIFRTSPMFVIHTYEGHGWEKILNATTHKMNKRPFVCGYQHAPLFPGPKSICHDVEEASPKHIFTTGEITRETLMKDCEIPGVSFSVLGSNKNKNNIASYRSQTCNCLFAPEGTMDEVLLMARIAVEAAFENSLQMYMLRLHPVLSRKKVLSALAHLKPFPKNFKISDNSLDDDLASASWLCYRGSSVVFQAILNRVKPIYLDVEDRAEYNDPLFGKLNIKKSASSGQQLNFIIKERIACEKTEQQMFEEAIVYVDRYLEPFSSNAMLELFNERYNDRT